MAGYMQAQDQVQAMVAQVKTLTVEKLKTLLRLEGLPVSGVKSELQIRTIAHIEKLRNARDQNALNRLRGSIRGIPSGYNNYPSPYSPQTPNSSASPQFSSPHPHVTLNMSSNSSFAASRIIFKNSPFYVIMKPLTQTVECRVRETMRDTVRLTVALGAPVAEQLASDPGYRVMVFCTSDPGSSSGRESEIAFPHNVELKCNSDDVKANLRGLKNRPGSTRPADITHLLRKKANYPNTVEMVYALTSKKFYLVVNLVHQKSIDTMVSELRRGRTISADQVLREMRTKAEDPDEIVETSSVLSLKDPVAYTRIHTPCRSIACNHNQCFDAAAYLQLQEQAPTWTCPICNKAAPWGNLAVDQYVNNILQSTPEHVEAVVVQPDGQWAVQTNPDGSNRNSNPTPSEDGDDEDLLEIQEKVDPQPKVETLTPHSVRTPPLSSSDASGAQSASRTAKRPREEVIDLTLSDDDEPPTKSSRGSYSTSQTPGTRASERLTFQMPPGRPLPHFDAGFSQ